MKNIFKRYSNNEIVFYVRRALWILFAWLLISNILFLYEYVTLKAANALDSNFDFQVSFQTNLLVGAIAGIVGGIFTVNMMEIWLRRYAFWKALTSHNRIIHFYCARHKRYRSLLLLH